MPSPAAGITAFNTVDRGSVMRDSLQVLAGHIVLWRIELRTVNEKQEIRAAVRAARKARALDADATSRARDGFTRELTRAVENLALENSVLENLAARDVAGTDATGTDATVIDVPDKGALAKQTRSKQTKATRVACFVSTRGEPDTGEFLQWASANAVEVLLPRSLPGGILEWAPLSAGPLRPGAFGIPEPSGPAAAGALQTVDAVFVPAAAIARDGTRLGWGRGYYDRELAALKLLENPPRVFGVVFESEIFENLPAQPHDIPVDGVISEVCTRQLG